MRDPATDRQKIIALLESSLAMAAGLHQYVLAYMIEHALAEAWTSPFPTA